jgi:uroporphyrinogen-III synthase
MEAARNSGGPLAGCRVVVTRPAGQAERLNELFAGLGAAVLSVPTIEIADPVSFDDLDAALQELAAGGYEWVGFLSVNAVEQVLKRLGELSLGIETIGRAQVIAVGKATARVLTESGIAPDLVPAISTAAGVAKALAAGGGRVLVPRAADAPRDALSDLRSQGWLVDEVVAYRTLATVASEGSQAIREQEFDVVTFTSGSTARGFHAMATPAEAGVSPGDSGARKVVCIGPETARIAAELGFRVDAVATDHSSEGLVQAVLSVR